MILYECVWNSGKTIRMYGKNTLMGEMIEYLSAIPFYESNMRSPSLMHRKNSCYGFGFSFGANG